MFDEKSRDIQYKLSLTKVDLKSVKNFMEILDSKIVTSLLTIKCPEVKYIKYLYIPRTESNFSEVMKNTSDDWISIRSNTSDIDSNELTLESTNFHTNEKKFNEETHIKVRLIASKRFPYDFEKNK